LAAHIDLRYGSGARMRTESLTIVFTDVKGYTAATSSQTHAENARMLRRIERSVAPVARAYGGRVVKSIGDSYLIAFRSPTEAVRCATAIQDRLHEHNRSRGADGAINVRIAMNVGEVRVHRGDVFGEPVNVAARIEGITPADDIYLSQAIYLTMNRSRLEVERVGEFELKGVPEPVTVYRAKRFARPGAGPGPAGAASGAEAAGEGPAAPPGATGEVVGAAASAPSDGELPFGGVELAHWRRMRWVRSAYVALWALVAVGVAGAAYLRYRPTADYDGLLGAMRHAVEQSRPADALALAARIPPIATEERSRARRLRHQAVAQLVAAGDHDAARTEVAALLEENGRDAEALLLEALLLGRKSKELSGALASVAAALRLNPGLAGRPEVVQVVVQGYRDPAARRTAEQLVEAHLQQGAVPALSAALSNPALDLRTRTVIAHRLEKLGESQLVDWVALALDELRSTSCKARLNAIARLLAENDERAVAPLRRIAESRGCGAPQARRAVDAILGK
jgi:class 3 adenylate cyclase